jgi:hypothetical protein
VVLHKLHFHDSYHLWVMADPTTPIGKYLQEWQPGSE